MAFRWHVRRRVHVRRAHVRRRVRLRDHPHSLLWYHWWWWCRPDIDGNRKVLVSISHNESQIDTRINLLLPAGFVALQWY